MDGKAIKLSLYFACAINGRAHLLSLEALRWIYECRTESGRKPVLPLIALSMVSLHLGGVCSKVVRRSRPSKQAGHNRGRNLNPSNDQISHIVKEISTI